MSDDRTIDNKIVSLDFKCDDFKKKLKDTEERIDSFNNKVDNIGSSKSGKSKFDELNDDANKLSKDGMSNVEKVVDAVKVKFDAFGVIGKRILEDITDMAFNAGEQLVKSLTVDQITESWSKYEAEVQAVQLLVTSLSSYIGKGSGAKKEYTNEQIEDYSYEKLKTLKWFADETSYSYSSMTNALAGFIRSGYHNVNASVEAIQGIATAAASAGVSISQSQELYSVWSTVISGGTMMTRQFDQLNKTYKAFTGDFKKTLLEAAAAQGTIKKLEDGTYQTLKGEAINIGNMRQYLNERIITADVAIQALEEYGQVSRKLNEMWEKDGIRAAEGLEKLRKANANVTDPKKIEELKKQGMYFSTIQLNAFEAAQACKTYADAIDATKDAVSTQWAGIWKSITGGYTEAKYLWTELCDYLWELFVPFVHYLNKAMEFWHAWGGWDKLFSVDEEKYGAVWKLFNALLDIINAVQEGLGRVFPLFSTFNDEAADFETNAKKIAAYLKYYTYKFSDWVDSILPKEEQLQTISDVTQGIVTLFKAVGLIAKFAAKYLKIAFDFVWDLSEPLRLIFIGLIKSLAILDDSSKKIGDNFKGAFGGAAEILVAVASKIKTFLYPILIKIYELGNKILPFVQSLIGFASLIFDLFTQIASPIIINAIDTISIVIDSITKILSNQRILDKVTSFGNIFITLTNIVSGAVSDLVSVLTNGLENVLKVLSTVTSAASTLVEDISRIIGDTIVNMFDIAWNVLERILPVLFDKLMSVDWMDFASKVGLIASRMLSALWNILLALGIAQLGKWVKAAFERIFSTDIRDSIIKLFEAIASAIKQYMIKGNVLDILQKVTMAFVWLTASLFVLSSLDFDRIIVGLTGIFGALGAMMIAFKAVMGAIDKNFVKPTEAFKKVVSNSVSYSGALMGVSSVLLSIGLSFLAVAGAMAILSKVIAKEGISIPKLVVTSAVLGALMTIVYGIFSGIYNSASSIDMEAKGSNKIVKNTKKMSKIFQSLVISMAVITLSLSLLASVCGDTVSSGELMTMAGVVAALMAVVYGITSAFYAKVLNNSELMKTNNFVVFKALASLIIVVAALSSIAAVFGVLVSIVGHNNISETKLLAIAGSISIMMAATALILSAFLKGQAKLPKIAPQFKFNATANAKFLDKFAAGFQLIGIAMALMAMVGAIGAIVLAITFLSVAFKGMTPTEIATVLGTLIGTVALLVGSIALLNKLASKLQAGTSRKLAKMLGQMTGLALLVAGMSFVFMQIGKSVKDSNVETMWHSVGMLGALFGILELAMLGLIGLSNIKTTDTKKLSSLQVNMMFLGLNVGSIVTLIEKLQPLMHEDPGSVWNAYGAIAAIMGLIGLVIFASDKYRMDKKGITNFLVITGLAAALGVAIYPMTYAIKSITETVSANTATNTWAAVGIIGAILGAFLSLTIILGKLSQNKWVLLGMAVAAVSFPLFGWGLQLMAKGINDMMPSVEKIVAMDPGLIWNCVGVLTAMFTAFSAIGGTGLITGPGLALLGLGILAIGYGLKEAFIPAMEALVAMEWNGIMDASKKLMFFGSVLGMLSFASLTIMPLVLTVALACMILLSGAALLVQAVASLENGFANLIEVFADSGEAAGEGLKKFTSDLPDSLRALGKGIGEFVDALTTEVMALKPKLRLLLLVFMDLLNDFLIDTTLMVTEGVTELTMRLTTKVNETVTKFLPDLLLSLGDLIGTAISYLIQALGNAFITIAEGVATYIDEHGGELMDAFYHLISSVSALCKSVVDNREWLKQKFDPIWEAISMVIEDYVPKVMQLFKKMLITVFANFFMDENKAEMLLAINSWADDLGDYLLSALQSLVNRIQESEVYKSFENLWNKLKIKTKQAFDWITGDDHTGTSGSGATFGGNSRGFETDYLTLNDVYKGLGADAKNGFLTIVAALRDANDLTTDEVSKMNFTGSKMKEAVKNLKQALYTGDLKDISADNKKKIDNFIRQYENNVDAVKAGVTDAGVAVGEAFLSSYEKTMRIESPARETWEDGNHTMMGLIYGVQEKFSTFKDTVVKFGTEVKGIFAEAFGFDQGKDAAGGFNILELMGLSDKNPDGSEKTLEQRFKEMLGIQDGEDGGSILDNIFGTNDFNINDWMGDSLTPDNGMFADMDAALSETADTADNTSEAISNAQDEKAKAAKANATSSRSGGQVYQNPQPGYTIIQNNYSPKALNSTEIYRRTKSTFAKLEGIKSV